MQKLLSFVLDNRDVTDAIGLRENSTGDEFTMVVYKSAKQRERVEAARAREGLHGKTTTTTTNANGTPTGLPTLPGSNENDKTNAIFNGRDLTEDGFGFSCGDMILDQSQTIPLLNRTAPRRTASKRKGEESEADLTADDDFQTDYDSQDEEFKAPKKRKRNSGGKGKASKGVHRKHKGTKRSPVLFSIFFWLLCLCCIPSQGTRKVPGLRQGTGEQGETERSPENAAHAVLGREPTHDASAEATPGNGRNRDGPRLWTLFVPLMQQAVCLGGPHRAAC